MIRKALLAAVEALFRVLFAYDCKDEEHVPAEGPAVVAANHPSYLDPVLLSLQVKRPIHFMAWDALFRVPLLGALIRVFGAFPVDVRPGKGREAYERARELVRRGEVVGIFPEGRRSSTGWMEPELRVGAARLAWETGAPLVPATIAGAFRAWPWFRLAPRLSRIRVRYHEPIDPTPLKDVPEETALPALLTELRSRVEASLQPAVRADQRFERLYATRARRVAAAEWLPHLLLGALLWRAGAATGLVLALAQVVYLLADRTLIPQMRQTKRLRDGSAAVVLGLQLLLRPALGLPPVAAFGALAAITAGATFPYLYERVPVARVYLRGLGAALLMDLAATAFSGQAGGLHVAIPIYAAFFALARHTVFWRWAALVLPAWAAMTALLLGADPRLLAHAAAGVTAGLAALALPYDQGTGGPGTSGNATP